MCLECRRRLPKDEMIRIAAVNGDIVLNAAAEESGRGSYLCMQDQCVKAFADSRHLGRILKRKVSPTELSVLNDELMKIKEEKASSLNYTLKADRFSDLGDEAKEKIIKLLGLAMKAGKTVCGTEACKKAVADDKAKLLFLAYNCGRNTEKTFLRLEDKLVFEIIRIFNKRELSKFSGRKELSVFVLTDDDFASGIKKLLPDGQNGSA